MKIQGTVISNIFYPPTAGASEKKDYDVLWVGGFNNMKCPEKFYQIAKALPQYRFAMIAKPCPESYLALQEQIQALPNVDYLGTVPFEQTQSYFNRTRLYLCTSAVEGFPNTFLQSWYARIPVVSVSFPCDGVLERSQCGLLSRTVEKCCNDISLCLENQQYCDIMGGNGFEYLEKNHLPPNLLQKMEEFLNKH